MEVIASAPTVALRAPSPTAPGLLARYGLLERVPASWWRICAVVWLGICPIRPRLATPCRSGAERLVFENDIAAGAADGGL
jgi:hypothetical protein